MFITNACLVSSSINIRYMLTLLSELTVGKSTYLSRERRLYIGIYCKSRHTVVERVVGNVDST